MRSPYIIFDSNERQQTKCLPKKIEKKEADEIRNARPAKLYYLALQDKIRSLYYFSFFGGFKITETSQTVRVGRQSPCMGCAAVLGMAMRHGQTSDELVKVF